MDSQTSKTGGSRRGPSFSLIEDETLCKAWLAVKEDPIIELSQASNTFWDRVLETFNGYMGASTDRTAKSISNRWCTIQQQLNIFCEFLSKIETTKKSDATLQGRITGAKRLYCVSQKCAFKWDGCWEILKDNQKWKEYQVAKANTPNAKKKMKSSLEIDPIAIEGASSTPTTPGSEPATPGLVPFDSEINLTSMDTLLREQPIGMKAENDRGDKSCEQIIHLSKVVEESNSLLKTLITSIDERLGRSEDIARKNLQLKEEKIRQRQLEMRENQFERDRIIMDMNLENMPPMQRQFYEMKQKDICDRWKLEGPRSGGSSGNENECNGDHDV